jgi:FtsP/CotA-like multicopper oxidase with cupredoxin domain
MSRADRSVLGWGAFAVAIAALVLAIFGLRDSSSAAGGESDGGGVTEVDVSLKEWQIGPIMTEIPAGEVVLNVTNDGTMVHNLSIPGLGVKTADLQPGESETLELGNVADGTYDMLCEIAGHAASGMTAALMVGSGGDGMTAPGQMDWQTMEQTMLDRNLQFPAKTEKTGGALMEPTRIDADGTKVYDVTVEEVQWEVEPGKFVTAKAYNGVVPGPQIHLEVGDKFRMNVKNLLDTGTSVHFHGIRVPNSMDGVEPYTQHVIQPGAEYVYEFTALEPAVGIYHSHTNGQEQIPDGLFGAFTIGEMPIPDYLKEKGYTKVDKTVNMVLNDAGTIGLSLNGKSFPATEPYTLRLGEVMKVNYYNEGLTAHPMHLHQPMGWIIAKDGVPLDFPMPGDTINIAPGERYTVLYKATDLGVWAWHCHILTHAESQQGMFGMVTALIVTQ